MVQPGVSNNRLGALYNPNYVDPRILPKKANYEPSAGIKTNYGMTNPRGKKNNLSTSNPYEM
jgi:hypothetical protein